MLNLTRTALLPLIVGTPYNVASLDFILFQFVTSRLSLFEATFFEVMLSVFSLDSSAGISKESNTAVINVLLNVISLCF